MKDATYLLDILVECPDAVSRVNIMNLVMFLNRKLLKLEKNILFDMTEVVDE